MPCGLRRNVSDDVEKIQVEQPRRPANEQRRRMAGLGALEKVAHTLEQPARIRAAVELTVAVGAVLTIRLRNARPVRDCYAQRVAEDLFSAAQQFFHDRKFGTLCRLVL